VSLDSSVELDHEIPAYSTGLYMDKYGGSGVEISSFSLPALTLQPFGTRILSQAVPRVAFGDINITNFYEYPFNLAK